MGWVAFSAPKPKKIGGPGLYVSLAPVRANHQKLGRQPFFVARFDPLCIRAQPRENEGGVGVFGSPPSLPSLACLA